MHDAGAVSLQPAPAPAPAKPPPSWWWLVGPLVLVVAAVVVFVVMLVSTVGAVTQVDARVPVDGEPHRVTVPVDGDRMLYAEMDTGEVPCRITDTDGREIVQSDYWGDVTLERDGRTWSALTTFDPGDGEIVVTCTEQPDWRSSTVLVSPSVEFPDMVAAIAGTVVAPMALGGAGVLWGVVLVVLVVTRRTAPG